jgi:hypothetical protein
VLDTNRPNREASQFPPRLAGQRSTLHHPGVSIRIFASKQSEQKSLCGGADMSNYRLPYESDLMTTRL